MTKKHFNALALGLAACRPPQSLRVGGAVWNTWDASVRAVAEVCAASSERFDYARFIEACETWNPVIRDGKLVKAA